VCLLPSKSEELVGFVAFQTGIVYKIYFTYKICLAEIFSWWPLSGLVSGYRRSWKKSWVSLPIGLPGSGAA
jgi:hypothetical protein